MVLQSCGQQIVKRQDMIEDGQRRLLRPSVCPIQPTWLPFGRSAYSAAKAYAIPLLPLVRRLLKRDWLLRLLNEFLKTWIAS